MRIHRIALVSIALLISFPALAADWPPIVSERIAKAKAAVKTVDMAALKKAVDKKEDVLILDVREPNEYNSGYVPGAINIPRGQLEMKIWKQVGYPDKLDTTRTIYVYCATAARSALAAETLTKLGFTHAYLVNMQLDDWKKAGYPLEGMGM